MSKITKIFPQKRKRGRFNVYLDGKFWVGVSEETLLAHGMRIGLELDENVIKKIEKHENKNSIYNKALHYLSFRPRSRKEIRDHLMRKKYPKDLIEKTIEKLEKYDFINDEQFARAWVQNRINLRPIGKKLLLLELLQKGVVRNLSEKIIEHEMGNKEKILIKQLASKKLKTLKNLPKAVQYRRLASFLARRGFGWDFIRDELERLKF